MNAQHLERCSSVEWAEHVESTLLPWAVDGRRLGDDLLEVGPGPGATTNLLRHRVARLTAIEYDAALAVNLHQRFGHTNVRVVHGDGTRLPFPDRTFSAAASFTMLHHVPSAALQDALLAEIARVLRPGGLLIGTDSLDSPAWRELHEGDVCVPIDPLTFGDRLRRAGFAEVDLTVWSIGTRFAASR